MESSVCSVSLEETQKWQNSADETFNRLGQEPPERLQEEVYDGRSLAEVCALLREKRALHAYPMPEISSQQGWIILFLPVFFRLFMLLTGCSSRGMGAENETKLMMVVK